MENKYNIQDFYYSEYSTPCGLPVESIVLNNGDKFVNINTKEVVSKNLINVIIPISAYVETDEISISCKRAIELVKEKQTDFSKDVEEVWKNEIHNSGFQVF